MDKKEEINLKLYEHIKSEYHKFFKFDEFLPKLEGLKDFVQDDNNAIQLYQALAENLFTWRASGGIVANLRGKGEDYIDYYCSGHEGNITRKTNRALKKVGIVLVKNYTWFHLKHIFIWRRWIKKNLKQAKRFFDNPEKYKKKYQKYINKQEKKLNKNKKKKRKQK